MRRRDGERRYRLGKRDHEDDYFRKQDRQLIERMRKAAADNEARAISGFRIPELPRDLSALGFSGDTVSLLPLGTYSPGRVGRRGREPGGAQAHSRDRPHPAASSKAAPLTSSLPRGSPTARRPPCSQARAAWWPPCSPLGSAATQNLSADDLVKDRESIAAASGGILGLAKVSAGERAAIEQVQKALKSR